MKISRYYLPCAIQTNRGLYHIHISLHKPQESALFKILSLREGVAFVIIQHLLLLHKINSKRLHFVGEIHPILLLLPTSHSKFIFSLSVAAVLRSKENWDRDSNHPGIKPFMRIHTLTHIAKGEFGKKLAALYAQQMSLLLHIVAIQIQMKLRKIGLR